MDAEAALTDCEDFLVDGPGGEEIGVVEAVERKGQGDTVSSLLVAAGWFGRKHLRVDRDAIEAVLLDERRIVVREAYPVPRETEGA
jgi:hypothetical protein